MNGRPATTSQAAYARAVERLWQERLERPVILSARDWALITGWHERGIPLQVVREALDDLAGRRRSSPPRGLSAIADIVAESWDAITAGRVAGAPPADAPSPAGDALGSWRRCAAGPGGGGPVGDLLRDLLARHAAGAPREDLDAALDEGLRTAAPEDQRRQAEREVDEALAPFRERMPAAALDETRRRAIADRLRGRLGLRRIAHPGRAQ